MGLDAVELVMEIEQAFGISIADDESLFFRTLGNLHDYLLEKCTGRKRTDCPTRSAFYRLRCAMAVAWRIEPGSIRPATPLLPLLGLWRRHRKWKALQRELALALPPLENWAGTGVFCGAIVAGLGGSSVAMFLTGDPAVALAAGMVGLLPGVLLGYVVGLLWTPTVGRDYGTVGGLARGVVDLNDSQFPAVDEPFTENDPVWQQLCDVLVRQLSVRRETLCRSTRFVEDLGL